METLINGATELAAKSEKTALVALAFLAICFIARESLRS